jgi:hypothetical protein
MLRLDVKGADRRLDAPKQGSYRSLKKCYNRKCHREINNGKNRCSIAKVN